MKTPACKTLWRGPCIDGVTHSLVSKFLQCRERFRLYVMDGLKEADRFNRSIEYGNMFHLCEEMAQQGMEWEGALEKYAEDLCVKQPFDQEKVYECANTCAAQFPVYESYWASHQDEEQRQFLMAEAKFEVTHKLPSGRLAVLKGKWDGVDLLTGEEKEVWHKENKTKGDVDVVNLGRRLAFDSQTMFYATAFREWQDQDDYGIPVRTPDAVCNPFAGVRYNVIRRPLTPGQPDSIRPHKATANRPAESDGEFYQRLRGLIEAKPETYFYRWRVRITPEDLAVFVAEFLDPVLESLCDWWDWVTTHPDPFEDGGGGLHWRHPNGLYNQIDNGYDPYEGYLRDGSRVGLCEAETVFPELI